MNWKKICASVLGALLLFVGLLAFFSVQWYLRYYGKQSINAIIFTLFTGWNGVERGLLISYIQRPLLMSVLCTGLITLFFCQRSKFRLELIGKKSGKRICLSPISSRLFALLSVVSCLVLLVCATYAIGLIQWVAGLHQQSLIFQEEYVEPKTTSITFPEKKRNLVYIYMESMETAFFSKEQGGQMDQCLVPELYDLAAQNTNFSVTDQVGGWECVTGGTWTTAGLVNQVGGIPLLLPFGMGNAEKMTRVLPGATLLWDILKEQGYYQMVMMGSDKNFSDQIKLVNQHGVDELKDYNSAIEEGFVPKDYFEWWGIEDEKLYAYARQELTRLASGEQPFNFTLFTIDTHFPNGFTCRLCGDSRAEAYENVYACASAQAAAFVQWLQEQPFYENTTVILCGDHLSMDQAYFQRKGIENADRWVYNCILNAPIAAQNTRNRVFSSLDMFPTTLAAMGCQIAGDRLALGTNLYSDLPTVEERLGLEALDQELKRSTMPYLVKFLLEDS